MHLAASIGRRLGGGWGQERARVRGVARCKPLSLLPYNQSSLEDESGTWRNRLDYKDGATRAVYADLGAREKLVYLFY